MDENRKDPTPEAARKLRNTVCKAKSEYWASKLDSVTDPTNVFRITKWHQLTGTYRSPLLKDPLHLDNSPATFIKEKRELLVTELFTSKAEVGDILLNISTAVTRHIDFPPITAEDVRKAVIEVSNTAPGADEVLTAVL